MVIDEALMRAEASARGVYLLIEEAREWAYPAWRLAPEERERVRELIMWALEKGTPLAKAAVMLQRW